MSTPCTRVCVRTCVRARACVRCDARSLRASRRPAVMRTPSAHAHARVCAGANRPEDVEGRASVDRRAAGGHQRLPVPRNVGWPVPIECSSTPPTSAHSATRETRGVVLVGGRWIWKTGKTKTQSMCPWNVQTVRAPAAGQTAEAGPVGCRWNKSSYPVCLTGSVMTYS